MKNRDIVAFYRKRAELSAKKLPMRLAYGLKLNYEKLQPCATAYDLQLSELRDKYVGEDGNVDQKKAEDYSRDIDELLNLDVNANIQFVDSTVLEKCDEEQFDSLTLGDLEVLSFMLNE